MAHPSLNHTNRNLGKWPTTVRAGTAAGDPRETTFDALLEVAAGQTVAAAAPLSHIPLFAPAGAIIPLGSVMRHVGAQPDARTLLLFPDHIVERSAGRARRSRI